MVHQARENRLVGKVIVQALTDTPMISWSSRPRLTLVCPCWFWHGRVSLFPVREFTCNVGVFEVLDPDHSELVITLPWLDIRAPGFIAGRRAHYPRRSKPYIGHFLRYPYRSFPPLSIPSHLGAEHGDDGHDVVPPQLVIVDGIGICIPLRQPGREETADLELDTPHGDFDRSGRVEAIRDISVALGFYVPPDLSKDLIHH